MNSALKAAIKAAPRWCCFPCENTLSTSCPVDPDRPYCVTMLFASAFGSFSRYPSITSSAGTIATKT